MKAQFFLLLFLLLQGSIWAQERIVSGIVQDAQTGEPLIGVNVKLQGVNSGVISDIDGKYRVNVDEGVDQLVFSYIGYETVTVTIGDRSIIDVLMDVSAAQLDEIVVVGYGKIRKSDNTGAVASVKSEDILKAPTSNAIDALQGKVSGLSVLSASGNPGAAPIVRLRGITTLNNNSPIFVVDGVITDDVAFLNPTDIASMEVLKDASSTAIFGSRGSNGVIIITTKSGTTDKPQINIALEQGFESVDHPLEVMNRDEFTEYYNLLDPNRFQNVDALPDTDWQDLVFRENTPITNLNASVSGRSEKINYYISGGYFSQEGVMPKSGFDRVTAKINTVYKITEGFELGSNLTFSHTSKENPPGIIGMLYRAFPIDDPNDPVDGSFTEVRGSNNPLAALEYQNSTTKGLSGLGNLYGQVTFLNDFRFKSSFQFDAGGNKRTDFTPEYFVSAVQQNELSTLNKSVSNRYQYIFENTLSYDKEFNDMNRLNVVAGMSSQVRHSEFINISTRDLLRDEPEFWYLDAGNPELLEASNNASESSLVSYFFRANYSLKNRYLFTVTSRVDGSSNFGRENRYAHFPSAAIGWNIAEEPFFDVGFVDNLKLRTSYGLVGNEKIQARSQFETIGVSGGAVFGEGEVFYPGVSFTGAGNPFLKWETTRQFNAGIDFDLWQGRLFGEVDYYNKVTDDILVFLRPSGWTGLGPFSTVTFNAGSVLNRGIEVNLNYRGSVGKVNFQVGILGNTVHNEVLSLAEDIGADSVITFTGAQTKVGESIGYIYGFDVVGVFQNEAQLDEFPRFANQGVGDFIYRDVDGNGVIDLEDRTKLGNSIPSYIYGFNLAAELAGFRLSMDFQGQYGNLIFNRKQQRRFSDHNFDQKFNTFWRGQNTTNEHPRPSQGGVNFNVSSYFMEPGSYLRLRTLTLDYTIPSSFLSAAYIQQANIYIRANNLFTITKFSGYTPDIGAFNALQGIVDDGIYPVTRVFSVGTNVTF